jgi:hypothetical protein
LSCGWKARNEKRRIHDRTTLRLVTESPRQLDIPQLSNDKATAPAASPGLGIVALAWLKTVQETFELTPTEAVLAEMAACALDVASKARELLSREGVLRYGEPHPAVRVEADSSAAYLRLIKQLNFPTQNALETNPVSRRA